MIEFTKLKLRNSFQLRFHIPFTKRLFCLTITLLKTLNLHYKLLYGKGKRDLWLIINNLEIVVGFYK